MTFIQPKSIDSCSEDVCSGDNEQCVNKIDGFSCICTTGYVYEEGQCVSEFSSCEFSKGWIMITQQLRKIVHLNFSVNKM